MVLGKVAAATVAITAAAASLLLLSLSAGAEAATAVPFWKVPILFLYGICYVMKYFLLYNRLFRFGIT